MPRNTCGFEAEGSTTRRGVPVRMSIAKLVAL